MLWSVAPEALAFGVGEDLADDVDLDDFIEGVALLEKDLVVVARRQSCRKIPQKIR